MTPLPTFLIIGAAKAGTTTMFQLLGEHPDVFTPDPKEPHYFSSLTAYDSARAWYDSLFSGAEAFRAAGEASTSYSHPSRIHFTAPRIRQRLPDCRLIYMVRHPVRRLESDWRMRCLEDRLSGPIGTAVEFNATLVTFGMYWRHLSVYRSLFPDEQILVIFLEDVAQHPERELRRAFTHIGVDADFVPGSLTQPRNTATARADSVAVQKVTRYIPGARRIASLLPQPAVGLARRILSTPARAEPDLDWSPHELAAVTDLFREDSRQLLRYCGKPDDFWDLGASE